MNLYPPINLKTGKTLSYQRCINHTSFCFSEKAQGYLTVDLIHLPVQSPKK